MNRNDRPDELRDRLIDEVPPTPTGFWAELTDRLEDADTDAGQTRLTTMTFDETKNRPPLRTRALALAAGVAVVAGVGAVALRGNGDVTTDTADNPVPTTVAASDEDGTSASDSADDRLHTCFGFQDPDNAQSGIAVRLSEGADGRVDAAVRFNDDDSLEVFSGERLSEVEFDGAVVLTNRTEGSAFFGRAELWYDSADDLRMAEDLVLPAVACGDLPAEVFADVDEVIAASPAVPAPVPVLDVGDHCFSAPSAPFEGAARVVVAGDGATEVRLAGTDGETSRAGVGRFVSDVDLLVTVSQIDGFEMEPFFERWIVADDGSLRPGEVVPAGVFSPIDCGDLPAGFETAGLAGTDAITAAGNGLGDVRTVDLAAVGIPEEGCWFTDASDDRVIVFLNSDGAVVELEGSAVRLEPAGDPVDLPFGVTSTYVATGIEIEVIAGEAASTELDNERFNGSVLITLPSGQLVVADGFHDCGV